MARTLTDDQLAKAWELRKMGCYTMRDIATDHIGCNRETLIAELAEWLQERVERTPTGGQDAE